MAKTILIAGYGPGISNAIAEKFGAEGFQVALVARNADKLAEGVKALTAKGIKAEGFKADFSDLEAIASTVGKVREKLGPITALSWSVYSRGAGDLLTTTATELNAVLSIATTSLVAAVQAVLPDLKADKESAVLVINGGLGLFNEPIDTVAANYGMMGLAVANSAKHKIVRTLHHKLKGDGVYVGEVMVAGTVKGTAFDKDGSATLDPSVVGAKVWEIYKGRKEVSVTVSS